MTDPAAPTPEAWPRKADRQTAAERAELGAARPVPRAPSGPRRVVLDAGGAGWTVLAALGDGDGEDGDDVRSLTVRRDS